jgi:hypothetical protein
LGSALVLSFHEFEGLPLNIITLAGWAVVILAAFLGAKTARRLVRDALAEELFASVKSEDDLYQDLLQKVRFDDQVVERLVEYERQYAPNASRATLLEYAIRRWERDNR